MFGRFLAEGVTAETRRTQRIAESVHGEIQLATFKFGQSFFFVRLSLGTHHGPQVEAWNALAPSLLGLSLR
jgi:hypothetical protein